MGSRHGSNTEIPEGSRLQAGWWQEHQGAGQEVTYLGSLSAGPSLFLPLRSEKLHAATGPGAGPCVRDHPGGGG